MNKKKKVSMQDIADALGVSKFSVSVAISDSYGVSEDLRLKILVKAMEMGYDFGRNNKRKNRKNNTVTLLVGGVEKAESIFWSSLIRSIEKTLVNENFDFSILIISNYETPKEMVARIYENHSVG
ncbi:MAG: LacI family DNA-binding transcriptional regulator, partial [Christensenellales bacterium]